MLLANRRRIEITTGTRVWGCEIFARKGAFTYPRCLNQRWWARLHTEHVCRAQQLWVIRFPRTAKNSLSWWGLMSYQQRSTWTQTYPDSRNGIQPYFTQSSLVYVRKSTSLFLEGTTPHHSGDIGLSLPAFMTREHMYVYGSCLICWILFFLATLH